MIDPEDFEQWRAHPVTEAMTRAMRNIAEHNKVQWIQASWGGGVADQAKLVDLRARAEVHNDLAEMTVEELNEALDDEVRTPT